MTENFSTLTPRAIVAELDRYIIGQSKAKRAVAIALRNRLRRQRLSEELREDIIPKNILMIGPTGVGKTEIARRLAKICGAPFIKVEATKFTEVGYVGRDVESIIRDLMAAGIAAVKEERRQGLQGEAALRAEERLLDLLLPGIKSQADPAGSTQATLIPGSSSQSDSREKFRKLLRSGSLDAREVEVSVSVQQPGIEIFPGARMEDMENAIGSIGALFGGRKKKKLVPVAEARRILEAEETDRLVDSDSVNEEARKRVEQGGIVFIDEIDKVASKEGRQGGGVDISREGVQRDLLPIVEGSTVSTKWGPVDTSHILFIAAGAFTVSKPQDLIPELQGRFPIRVELESLTAKDFERILTEPRNALIGQYVQLLATEDLTVEITQEAVARIASIAASANSIMENIGARRLHTVMEKLLEDLSFEASEMRGASVIVDVAFVDSKFVDFVQHQDLGKYIL